MSRSRRCSMLGNLHCLFASLVILSVSTSAHAQTWNITSDGNWSTPGNWTPSVPVPGAATALLFGNASNPNATYIATNNIGTTPFDLNSLTFNGNAGTLRTIAGTDPTLNGLNFTGTDPILTMGAGDVTITSNTTLANTGVTANSSVPAGGTQGTASLTVAGGAGTLTFSGTVNSGPAAVPPVTLFKTSSGQMVFANGGIIDQLSIRNGGVTASGGTLSLTLNSTTDTSVAGLQIGSASGQTGTFTASNGAIVNITENAYIGDFAGSTGTMTVTGAGTTVNLTGGQSNRLAIGNFGNGTLNILNGGVVNAGRLFTPRQAGGSSTILVDGPGSMFHIVTQASFASNGVGNVTVQNGGKIVTDGSFNMGINAPGTGTILVTGSGSNVTATTGLSMGAAATGGVGPLNFNIQNGASLNTGNSIFIALNPGTAVSTMSVTDAGSTITNGGLFVMCVNGTTLATGTTGILNIGNGATVTANGFNVAAGATVNLNAGGSLTTGSISDPVVGSTGTFNLASGTTLNITSRAAATSSLIAGPGAVQIAGTAVQTFGGANTYQGGTTINAGALVVSNTTGSATGPGAVTVNNTGFLSGIGGTVTGTVLVNSGGSLTGGDGTATFPTGILNLTGATTLATGGQVDLGIDGTTPGSAVGNHDQIALGTTGTITLTGGVLSVGPTTGGTYIPMPSDIVTIIQSSAGSGTHVVGQFANAPAGPGFAVGTYGGMGYTATVTYNPNSVVLSNFTPVPVPGGVMLACGAVAGVVGFVRRRKPAKA